MKMLIFFLALQLLRPSEVVRATSLEVGEVDSAELYSNDTGLEASGDCASDPEGCLASDGNPRPPWNPLQYIVIGAKARGNECGCELKVAGNRVCTCVIFCQCPNNDCDAAHQGSKGCHYYEPRKFYIWSDGSGGTACESHWVIAKTKQFVPYNWIYFWVPGIESGDIGWLDKTKIRIALGGSDSPNGQFGAYCLGWPLGGYHYDATNGGGNGWALHGYYYVRSYRVDTEYETFGKGSDSGNIGIKLMLWPKQDLAPYDQISCKGKEDGRPFNKFLGPDYPIKWCKKNCQGLIPRCASSFDRVYCMSVNDLWGGGIQDDLALYGYDFEDGANITYWFPMLSGMSDRYTDTLKTGVGKGNGHFCNPGNPGIDPKPGTCILTRFYYDSCKNANDNNYWAKAPAKGSSASTSTNCSPYVLGCGTTKGGKRKCGGDGQSWGTYFNADKTYTIRCIWTRVVDDQDGDCAYRLYKT